MQEIFSEYKKEIFKNHQNCGFFELFLLPWISIETIENVSEKLFDNIRLYLNYCCNLVTDHVIRSSKSIHELDISIALPYIDEIKSQDPFLGLKGDHVKDDKSLFSYIKSIFPEELNLAKIKIDDNKSIIIVIKSSDSNRRILLYKDKESIPNIISFNKNIERSSLFPFSINHKSIIIPSTFKFEDYIDLKSLYHKAVFSIVNDKSKDDDLNLLKEDIKFMDTLSELKEFQK